MVFEWCNAYNVDIGVMDEQHHKLVNLLNRVNVLIKEGVLAPQDWIELLNELASYTKYHFSTEEDLMMAHGYEGSAEHLAEHVFFIERVAVFKKSFESYNMKVADDLLYFLMVWLQNHILIVDHKLAAFLNQKGCR